MQPASLSTDTAWDEPDQPVSAFNRRQAWHAQAACYRLWYELEEETHFTDGKGVQVLRDNERAKRWCQQCPVVEICIREALVNRERFGVWGGTDPTQRKSLLALIDEGKLTVEDAVDYVRGWVDEQRAS